MSETTATESRRREPGAVEALARDDVERKKFLSMAGRGIGAGAAATGLAAFIAACGSSKSSSSVSGPPRARAQPPRRGVQRATRAARLIRVI